MLSYACALASEGICVEACRSAVSFRTERIRGSSRSALRNKNLERPGYTQQLQHPWQRSRRTVGYFEVTRSALPERLARGLCRWKHGSSTNCRSVQPRPHRSPRFRRQTRGAAHISLRRHLVARKLQRMDAAWKASHPSFQGIARGQARARGDPRKGRSRCRRDEGGRASAGALHKQRKRTHSSPELLDIASLHRVPRPKPGITKLELARYYVAIGAPVAGSSRRSPHKPSRELPEWGQRSMFLSASCYDGMSLDVDGG